MELKIIGNCSCGYEFKEKDVSVIVDTEICEMDFTAKCPICQKKESVSIPHEVKMRLIKKDSC